MHGFRDPGHFLQWLQGEEETSADVCVRGVPARGGAGSQEVTDFVFKELRLARLRGRLQKRALRYLKNRCGHQFSEEEAFCQALEEPLDKERKKKPQQELSRRRDFRVSGDGKPRPLDDEPASSLRGIKESPN